MVNMLGRWSEMCIQNKVFLMLQLLAVGAVLLSLHKTKDANIITIMILTGAVLLPLLLWAWVISILCKNDFAGVAWLVAIAVPAMSVLVSEMIIY